MPRCLPPVLIALAGCYLSHELPADGAVVSDGPISCVGLGAYLVPEAGDSSGAPAARLDGVGGDVGAGTLTFDFSLDCSWPGCARSPLTITLPDAGDLAGGAAFADAVGMSGHLAFRYDDGARIRDYLITFSGTNGGHRVELMIGRIPSASPTGAVHTSAARLECSDACNDYLGVHVEGFGTSLDTHTHATAHSGPLTVRMWSAYEHTCLHCGCTLPDVHPTGLVYFYL